MITITPDNQIVRDGETIGSIITHNDGSAIAWMRDTPAPRVKGQIRQAAGINGLAFEIVDTPGEEAKLSPPISSAESVDAPSVTEPVPVSDDAGAGISFAIGSDWGTPGTPYFARCFINNHGSDAYAQYCKANGI